MRGQTLDNSIAMPSAVTQYSRQASFNPHFTDALRHFAVIAFPGAVEVSICVTLFFVCAKSTGDWMMSGIILLTPALVGFCFIVFAWFCFEDERAIIQARETAWFEAMYPKRIEQNARLNDDGTSVAPAVSMPFAPPELVKEIWDYHDGKGQFPSIDRLVASFKSPEADSRHWFDQQYRLMVQARAIINRGGPGNKVGDPAPGWGRAEFMNAAYNAVGRTPVVPRGSPYKLIGEDSPALE